jgi:hypothetical protein
MSIDYSIRDFELTGEYRLPVAGEYVLCTGQYVGIEDTLPALWVMKFNDPFQRVYYPIMRRKEKHDA